MLKLSTLSTRLQNKSFQVVERTRASTKCQKMKNAHAKRAKYCFHCHWNTQICGVFVAIVDVVAGSLSNHDDDGSKNPSNLHIWQWKTIFLHALHVHSSFFSHFADVLVVSTTWNDLFCSCVNDVSIWWQMLNFVFLWFQFNSRIVRIHFASVMTLNCKIIAETRSYIFRWHSCCRRRRLCLIIFFSIITFNSVFFHVKIALSTSIQDVYTK